MADFFLKVKAKRQPQVAVFSVCSLSPWERARVRASVRTRRQLLTLNIKNIRTQMVVVNFL
ncbi:hypothetical protein DP195_18950 [Enterobacter asburiae]|nr:hypothetical protein DP195_18950 [Enterobacter asburiae]